MENLENVSFAELKARLELRFGDGRLTQNYYSLFTSRKQKLGEDLASFGAELERLSRLAYPECSAAVRDKIACAQFVSALGESFIKRTLQLEGVSSLRIAVERAKTIKIIQEESFRRDFREQERKDARGNGAWNVRWDGEDDPRRNGVKLAADSGERARDGNGRLGR